MNCYSVRYVLPGHSRGGQETKKGQENDWKVSFTTCVVPTQEEEMHSTTSRPPRTFRTVLAQVW